MNVTYLVEYTLYLLTYICKYTITSRKIDHLLTAYEKSGNCLVEFSLFLSYLIRMNALVNRQKVENADGMYPCASLCLFTFLFSICHNSHRSENKMSMMRIYILSTRKHLHA